MEIEFCPLCEQELSKEECSLLEHIVEKQETSYSHYHINYEDDVLKQLEQKQFLLSHETNLGIAIRAKYRPCLIEFHRYENGHFQSEEKKCKFICRDFDHHNFLLEKSE